MEQQSDMPQRQRIFERTFSFKGRIKRTEFAMSYVITWIVGGIISMSVDEPEYVTELGDAMIWDIAAGDGDNRYGVAINRIKERS